MFLIKTIKNQEVLKRLNEWRLAGVDIEQWFYYQVLHC